MRNAVRVEYTDDTIFCHTGSSLVNDLVELYIMKPLEILNLLLLHDCRCLQRFVCVSMGNIFSYLSTETGLSRY